MKKKLAQHHYADNTDYIWEENYPYAICKMEEYFSVRQKCLDDMGVFDSPNLWIELFTKVTDLEWIEIKE